MADSKLTGLTEDTAPTSDDLIYTVTDPAGTPASRRVTLGNVFEGMGATRFVPIDAVQVLNTDPSVATFADLDVTAQTSANCYAIVGVMAIVSGTTARTGYIRKNGSSIDTSAAEVVGGVANSRGLSAFTVGVDTDQIFEWRVSNADVTSAIITINGYWEYIV